MNRVASIASKRLQTSPNVLSFNFNLKRVRNVNDTLEIPKNSSAVVYWMSREHRVQDNWGLLYAQRIALRNQLPLYVCFCLVPTFLGATIRHYNFMIEGLKEVEKELTSLKIPFFLLRGSAEDVLPNFIEKNKAGAVVCDFSPLRIAKNWLNGLKEKLNIPIYQVDGHNVIPCWECSNEKELAAFKIRAKILPKLNEYLTEFPPVISHPIVGDEKSENNWEEIYNSLTVDMQVKPIQWAKPGYSGAISMLDSFITQRLPFYNKDRNDPNTNVQSNLSPYFHFGQISPQRAILEVNTQRDAFPDDVSKFVDEALVWRELSENFCYYQPNYDNFNGAEDWAKKTLTKHLSDKRQYVYTLEQFENAKTHDPLWNAAQIQMIKEGKMHGFFRMYWGKKILEWTETTEKALEIAIYLNDRYSIDGRDPNGYAGIMWAIAGVHDHSFKETSIYGCIRLMTFEGSKKKFDVYPVIRRYNKL